MCPHALVAVMINQSQSRFFLGQGLRQPGSSLNQIRFSMIYQIKTDYQNWFLEHYVNKTVKRTLKSDDNIDIIIELIFKYPYEIRMKIRMKIRIRIFRQPGQAACKL